MSILHPLYSILETYLPSVEAAAFDSHVNEFDARCHPGTRIDLLRRIREWAQDPKGKCIFWLNGMAGTGKSTISRTVAESFAKDGLLGASFFFKKGEVDRGNASKVFTTITLQLVHTVSALALYVKDAIDTEPKIAGKSLGQQFKKLILEPLSKARQNSKEIFTLVILLDALDECEPEEHISAILRLLPQIGDIPSVRMRVFLTSRPELPIRLGFKEMSADAYQDIILERISLDTIKTDISIYLMIELAMIKNTYNLYFPDSLLPPDWPGDANIRLLVAMTVPLFIFAATVCRFVGDTAWDWDPKRRLAIILEPQTIRRPSYLMDVDDDDDDNSELYPKLDQTYLPILQQLAIGCTNFEKKKLAREFRKIVGSIIILADPLSTSSLASLLGISKQDIDCRLQRLHSVLSVPSNQDSPVRLLHLSFRDFLLDPKKQGKSEFWFWIDEVKTHDMIVTQCLDLMSRRRPLRENMCNLEFPGKLRKEIDRKTLECHLPPDVQYACQYWIHHLKECKRRICDQDVVHVFLQQHFLRWLEALSLMGKISESIPLIDTLRSLVSSE
jgi:hypothetical protein